MHNLGDPLGHSRDRKTCHCKWCGSLTYMTGIRMCDNCWEMERRIRGNPEVAAVILAEYLSPAAWIYDHESPQPRCVTDLKYRPANSDTKDWLPVHFLGVGKPRCMMPSEKPAGEPKAWLCTSQSGRTSWTLLASELTPAVREAFEADGIRLDPLYAGAPLATAPAPAGQPLQGRVQPWLMECFGPMIVSDREVWNHREMRNHRFLEEALELVQSCGCSASEAHQLVDYVYGRPVGEPGQEVGGVMITLAALCLANGLDMHAEGERELKRISTPEMTAKIRAKQAAKPKHSPLPIDAPAEPASDTGRADGKHWLDGFAGLKVAEPAAPVLTDDGTKFLCRIWGEDIDHTLTAIVPDWEGVRRFIVEYYTGSEDHSDYYGKSTLETVKENFDEHEEDQRGGAYEEKWEIGGMSIERICDCSSPAAVLALTEGGGND